LHLITDIDTVAKKVFFQDQTRDTYSTSTHTITLRAFRPNFFSVKNIEIDMPAPTSFTATVGIQIGQCFEPILENIRVKGVTNWGLCTVRCWRPLYKNISAYGLGRPDQNGYGISVKGCLGARVDGLKTWGCRRGIDMHGLQGNAGCVSRDWIVEDFDIHGGGIYYPDTDVVNESYGLGMHGPTENGVFRNGIITDVSYGVNVRTRNLTIENVTFAGTMLACVSGSFGTGMAIRDCKVDRGDYPNKLSSWADAASGSGVQDFLRLGVSTGSPEAAWLYDLPLIVEGVDVQGLTRSLIHWFNDATVRNLRVSDISGQVTPGAAGTFTVYMGASPAVDVHIAESLISEEVDLWAIDGGSIALYSSPVIPGYRVGNPDRASRVGDKDRVAT